MTVTYIEQSNTQSVKWIAAGVCMWCGSERVDDPNRSSARFECGCRQCPSCNQVWISETPALLIDGTPRRELCPNC
jgi:hypothetical protein